MLSMTFGFDRTVMIGLVLYGVARLVMVGWGRPTQLARERHAPDPAVAAAG